MSIKFWCIYYVFLKIMGIAPMSWLENSTNKLPFKTSSKGSIYSVVFLFLYTVMHLYLVIHSTELFKKSVTAVILTLVSFFVAITFAIVFTTILTLALKQTVAVGICNELHEIDQFLNSFHNNNYRKKIDTKLKVLIIINAFFCIIFPINEGTVGTDEILLWLLLINSTLASWVVMQYVGIVAIMDALFRAINNQFLQFYSPKVFEVKDKNDGPSQRLTKIEALQEIYIKLVKAATKYANFYSYIVLMVIIKIFVAILVDTFAIIKFALEEEISPTLSRVMDLLWLLWDILLLLSVSFSVTKLSSEVSL